MSVLLLVRHGETVVNAEGRLQGRVDADLTASGREQAQKLAVAIAPLHPVAVVSSPLGRARETAGVIAAACDAAVDVDGRLVELDYGDWDGRPLGDIPAEAWKQWRDDPAFAPPGGESLAAVRRRVAPCCEELLAARGVVVAVSHVTPIKEAVAWTLAVGDEVSWRMHLGLASITRVELRAGRPCLVAYGETAHLATGSR